MSDSLFRKLQICFNETENAFDIMMGVNVTFWFLIIGFPFINPDLLNEQIMYVWLLFVIVCSPILSLLLMCVLTIPGYKHNKIVEENRIHMDKMEHISSK